MREPIIRLVTGVLIIVLGYGCEGGTDDDGSTDPCDGVTCDSPPDAHCLDDTTLRTYESEGTCTDGECTYPLAGDVDCEFGCLDGACEPDPGCEVPSYVEVVETGVPESGYREHFWSVAPSKVHAFKFRTVPGTEPASQMLAAARIPGAVTGKRVEVSLCPGGSAVSSRCSSFSAEATSISCYTNVTEDYVCILEPDTVYYANVWNKYDVTDAGYNCGSASAPDTPSSECAFIYEHH